MRSESLIPVCFVLQVKPEFIDEYRDRHSPVWPDMLRAIRDAGWTNYSIFMREDGLLSGYFETDDLEKAKARMEAFEVSERWAADSEHLFIGDQQWLTPVFNLEDQLRDIGELDVADTLTATQSSRDD
jgi:L-rhamnose mutarotase